MLKSLALLALFVFFSGPALSGTITITVTTSSGTCSTPCTKTYTDTDGNLAKIVPAYQLSCNGKLGVGSTCTPTQVLAFWFDNFIAGTVSTVSSNEKNQLLNSAVGGYVPINPQ